MKKQVVQKSSVGKNIAAGVTIAAGIAAAYLLFGPDAKKNRKIVRGWAIKMKGEIIEKFEKAKDVTESSYHAIVDQIAEKYAKIKGVEKSDIDAIVQDARKHWKTMTRTAKKKGKK